MVQHSLSSVSPAVKPQTWFSSDSDLHGYKQSEPLQTLPWGLSHFCWVSWILVNLSPLFFFFHFYFLLQGFWGHEQKPACSIVFIMTSFLFIPSMESVPINVWPVSDSVPESHSEGLLSRATSTTSCFSLGSSKMQSLRQICMVVVTLENDPPRREDRRMKKQGRRR